MKSASRREFLADVGKGMLLGTVGLGLAVDLGFVNKAFAEEDDGARLRFGELEPLVDLIQGTPPEPLLKALVDRVRQGTDLRTLTAATALANARRFAGDDYVGYHTFMALAPALFMSRRLPTDVAPLPVLKVIHRNAVRIQEDGGPRPDHMELLTTSAAEGTSQDNSGESLRRLIRVGDRIAAEQSLTATAATDPGEAFNHLQFALQDEVDVHRIVLPWRAWETLKIVGNQHAGTLLRQSVRFCVAAETARTARGGPESELRALLPRLLEEYRLTGGSLGDRTLDDAGLQELAHTVFANPRTEAAEAVASRLADGFSVEAVGEAIALAACWLVLHDPGREIAEPGKPVGSVHGASVGVHASDAANAWRQVARVSPPRHQAAGMIAAAFHTAGQAAKAWPAPWPLEEHLRGLSANDPALLLKEMDGAVRENNQSRACALVQRYAALDQDSKPVFELFLRFATSEDGQLHAEKYFQTVNEEFQSLRPSARWQELIALARVTASEYGTPSPGYHLGRELLAG